MAVEDEINSSRYQIKYQLELCKKAMEENIIVFLGTGCGKTHIAVLLIYELGHLIRKPEKSVCVFLAPTIPLVRQRRTGDMLTDAFLFLINSFVSQRQASVIEECTDFKVGSYYGHSKRIKNHQEWDKELEEYEVLVMTPQILLHNLLHRLIKMELIALLIFDECHHAQAQSSHPYAEIMKEYKTNAIKRPRIFGMTASPIVGKGGASPDSLPRGINSLENLLDAKVYSVEDKREIEKIIASPKVKCYYYDPTGDCKFRNTYLEKLEKIKNQLLTTLRTTTEDVKILRNYRKVLQRLQDNLLFCLENLGLFGAQQLNLLVATRVGEEGLDIQTCCLVVRFDLPETVASFIQSRGRARMSQSEYSFLVERDNHNELNLIKHFMSEEARMVEEITSRTSEETFDTPGEANYRVPSTGACISAGYSVSLLHRYCSKLPHDEFFIPKPEFSFFDDNGGVICHIILPSNAALHEVRSPPQSSREKAKKIACLRACKELHVLGALTDHLLPVQDDEFEEESKESSTYTDESPRGELHEMLSPSILKNQWDNSENPVHLNVYFMDFVPVPNDRLYQRFGLFVKMPLPRDAETMEIDLHLAHGRIVKTKLVPLGVMEFGAVEIVQAQNFQELYLKIILDRAEFFADFVQLGKSALSKHKHPSFYLLLPVRQNMKDNSLIVDWEIIRRCLSSPIFVNERIHLDSGVVPAENSLLLANGPASRSDVVNSLILTPHNGLFFFVDDIFHGIDANSPFTDQSASNYVEHYAQK
ncbi:endoribonuclease Dicer [Ranunculus cassubicifolius]